MTGCFSCFGSPKVKHEDGPPVPKAAFPAKGKLPSTGKQTEAINSNDKLAAPLLKASTKGSLVVAERCKELLSSTRAWGQDLRQTSTVRARTSALQCSIDTLLAPLLETVDASVGKPGQGGEAGWEGLQLKDLEGMFASLCLDATGLTLQGLASCLGALTGALQAVWAGSVDLRLRVGTAFHNQSTNNLLGMMSVILSRQVTHEPQAVWQQRLSDWRSLSSSLGLAGPGLAVSLNPQNKALLLYLINASEAGENKVTLKVLRGSALSDTVQILQKSGTVFHSSGPVKVFPLFRLDSSSNAVEAGEGHGPRKEFFHAVGQSMTQGVHGGGHSGDTQPFSYSRSAGQYFLNLSLDHTEENRALMWTTGWLMAQTVSNRANLGIPLPELLLQMLIQGTSFKPDMHLLAKFDPEVANGLKNIGRLSDSDFKAMLELEECTGMSREQYLQHAISSALGVAGDSSWIFNNLKNGFWSVFSHKLLQELSISETDLREMVCGPSSIMGNDSANFNVQEVFRVILDEEMGGGDDNSHGEPAAAPLACALWEVVGTWKPELKRQFVLFVTGSDRLPLPGTELLRVELPFVALSSKDHKQMLGMLPQAHTCENILELPNYWEALLKTRFPKAADVSSISAAEQSTLKTELKKVLEERLMLAVTSCNSYGLDEGVGTSGASSQGPSLTTHSSGLPPLPYGPDRGPLHHPYTSHSSGNPVPLGRPNSSNSLGRVSSEGSSDMSAGPSYLTAMMDEKVVPVSHSPAAVLPVPVRNKDGLQPLRDTAPQKHNLAGGGGSNVVGPPNGLPVLGAEPSKQKPASDTRTFSGLPGTALAEDPAYFLTLDDGPPAARFRGPRDSATLDDLMDDLGV